MLPHLEGTLAPPAVLKGEDFTMWLEQQIWGHRFHNDQTPWLLLLEALGLMASRAADANKGRTIFPGLADGTHESFSYKLESRIALRDIVFRDRHLDEVAAARNVSNDASWRNWLGRVQPLSPTAPDYGYLKERFTHFSGFRDAVHLLRSAEVEAGRKRRTTSRHFAPRGPDLLCADVALKKTGAINKDRRFFARGGELLYFMLNRSRHAEALDSRVAERLLSGSRWNALARAVQPPGEGAASFDTGYLPLARHGAYDRLAADWLAILSLDHLPGDSVPEPLMRLSGLGVMLYLVERAGEILGEDPAPIPLDMMSPSTVGVQRIAKDCYRRHRDITRRAVAHIVDDFLGSDAWDHALAQQNAMRSIRDLVKSRFEFVPKAQPPRPEGWPDLLKETALGIHDGHLGRVAGFYAEQIGLAVARQGAGRWYGASDSMLEALVFANVREPMELEAFLDRLWDRYRMVVGTHVGTRIFETVNYGHLKANQLLFEERLRVLGLAERLSDDCAFVVNPFYKVEA